MSPISNQLWFKIRRMIQWMWFHYSPSSLDMAPLIALARQSPPITSNDEFYVSAGGFFLPPLMAENYELQVPHFKTTNKGRGRRDLTSDVFPYAQPGVTQQEAVSFYSFLWIKLQSTHSSAGQKGVGAVWKATGAVHSGSCRGFFLYFGSKDFFCFFLWQHNCTILWHWRDIHLCSEVLL